MELLTTASSFAILFALPFILTYLVTNVQYASTLAQYFSKQGNRKPIQVPYIVPLIGNALAYLTAPRPGHYWSRLFSWLPQRTGVCTLIFFGQKTHFVYNDTAVQCLFKAKNVRTEGFRNDVLVKGFGLEQHEAHKFYGTGGFVLEGQESGEKRQEKINQNFLLQAGSVSELTHEFIKALQQALDRNPKGEHSFTVDLYSWMRGEIFNASTTALFGKTLLERSPEIQNDFFNFERRFVSCLFGLPRWAAGDIYEVRERLISQMAEWHEYTLHKHQGHIPDPIGPVAWHTDFGSRFHRARRILYQDLAMSPRARASADLSTMFGLSGNAIPCIGWMLLHLLNPDGTPGLLPRVLEEVAASKTEEGNIDIPKLLTLPLLNSIFHEIMRLYLDVPVTRQLTEDLTLPLGKAEGSIKMCKGDVVQAPSWVCHHDDRLWPGVPANVFHAERFLAFDTTTRKTIFSTAGSAGKLFPFGGGKSICPGRNFAKQEVLGAVATILDKFRFEPFNFVDLNGRRTDNFPTIKEGYAGNGMVLPRGDLRVKVFRY